MKQTLLTFLAILLTTAHAAAQTPFFQGKTIRIAVGYLAGDTHDLWARAYARNLGNISREIQKSSSRTCPVRAR